MSDAVAADADALLPELLEFYTDLHRNPEVGFAEHRTTERIVAAFEDLGLEVHRPDGATGAVGVLRGGDGPVVALRADIDALPIAERTGLAYSSEWNESLAGAPAMHACGHDVHATALLGALRLLVDRRDAWSGTVIALAQPAEELGEGARRFIASGVLDPLPVPDVVLGQHVGSRDAAPFVSRAGAYEAAQRNWRVTFRGPGGHAAAPHRTHNPLGAVAQLVTRLQAVPSLALASEERAVLVATTVHGGAASNVIPVEASATFCARALSSDAIDVLDREVARIARALAAVEELDDPDIVRFNEFPLTTNDAATLARVVAALEAEFGADAYAEAQPLLGSEDFGEFATHWAVPSAYWHFDGGTAPEVPDAEAARRGHSPTFAPDPTLALPRGTRALTVAALAFLGAAAERREPPGAGPAD